MDLTNYKNNSIVFETLIFNVMNVVVLKELAFIEEFWGFPAYWPKSVLFSILFAGHMVIL